MRRAAAGDAEMAARAVAESLEHLRPWMPWATAEATDPAFQRERPAQAPRPKRARSKRTTTCSIHRRR